jgi:hypothetical protein
MAPVRVIPTLNPGEYGQARLGVRLADPPVNQLTFERGKEAFRHRVVIGITHRVHAGAHTHLFAAFAKRHARVMAAFGWSGG